MYFPTFQPFFIVPVKSSVNPIKSAAGDAKDNNDLLETLTDGSDGSHGANGSSNNEIGQIIGEIFGEESNGNLIGKDTSDDGSGTQSSGSASLLCQTAISS